MSKQPLGKTLLRNVIRHTDAHNKIQEEMEMWKMRDWEVHQKHSAPATGCLRGQMHCDRVSDSSRGRSREHMSEHDDREARYWTRKLYDFEDNDPDRWGHSGFKELYPEEFESDSENSDGAKKIGRHRIKKSKPGAESTLTKRSKKSSRKKKKKKKKKKVEEEKRKKTARSISDSSSSDDDSSSAGRDKQRRKKSKSRHKNKKGAKSRGRDEDSSSGESDEDDDDDDDDDKGKNRRTQSRKRRKQDSHKDSDSGLSSKKKRRRKNWKAADGGSSDDSSGD